MIDGAALDRWITGNYGEDAPGQFDEMCLECEHCDPEGDDPEGDDPFAACAYDGEVERCRAEAAADAACDAWKDGDGR